MLAAELVTAGTQAEREGRLEEACVLYRRAIDADPSHAAGYLNLGAALEASGEHEAAARAYRALLELAPGNPYASYNLANLSLARGETQSAEKLLRTALRSKEDFPEAHVALSNVLDAMERPEEAAEHLAIALNQRPGYAGAWYNYGVVLGKLQHLDQAEDALRRALELDPRYIPAYQALAGILRGEARIEEALHCYATARARAPDALGLESGELFTLLFSDRVSDEELATRHLAFGARLEAAHAARPHAAPDDPGRRLRVGYVSADLYRHPVALFLIPVLARHDRSRFDVRCYMTGGYSDPVTLELQRLADGWRNTASMSDAEMADTIRGDAIDILVDLTGHAGASRLGVFAEQPAPVQVSWLGYLHTTGTRRIQYRLCDGHTDPSGSEHLHAETLVRLPHSQWCYRPFLTIKHADAPPCASRGFVTFGSFNHPSKLSPTTRRLWRDLLVALPDSRLVVVGVAPGRGSESLLRDLAAGDVAQSRIELVSRLPLDEYFRRFNEVDIALDTSPYSGGTTTCDALWMGLGVVTAPGSRPVSRSAASLLATVGLADWIAPTPERYIALALDKARNASRLAELRRTLRARMRASPLMDEAGFTRSLEDAYRRMWHRQCTQGR
jgi:predicted O-linked N-acetylglucosamine transferase (SPINDLY family)